MAIILANADENIMLIFFIEYFAIFAVENINIASMIKLFIKTLSI